MDNTETSNLSIVVPVYNEAGNIEKLYTELEQQLPKTGLTWEIIYTDDGSSDQTWDLIQALREKDLRVKAIRLSRNFGHQYALFAGLSYATGDAVISMDGDMQHPPDVIPQMVEKWKQGNKIVHTVRKDSEDISLFKRHSSRLYYQVFSYLSGVKIEIGMADFRLLDRQVLDHILQFREEGLFLRGIVQWVGFPSTKVTFQSNNRFSGSRKYTLKQMIKLAWTGITSFSVVPLRIGIFIGILTSLIAFTEMLYAIYAKLFTDTVVPGWASAVSILSFLFGILFILLGLVGEYIGRILVETRARPRFLVSDTLGLSPESE
ncbi:MAG: glycosyltransferase family 2 protein [Pseudomonadota bacterium]